MFLERSLHLTEHPVPRESLHRPDRCAIGLHCKDDARAHWRPVEVHGACSTHALLTTHMCAREPEVVSQEVGEQAANWHDGMNRLPIDR